MITSRPMSRITVGEAYYELIDNYETLTNIVENSKPEDMIEVSRWDTQKKMLVRVGSIDTVQEVGF